MSRLTDYLKDTKVEMKHVSWPTQRQAMIFTAMVVAFSVVVALILGLADYLFTSGLRLFINN